MDSQEDGASRWNFDRDNFSRGKFNISSLRQNAPGLEDYKHYAEFLPEGDSYYYTLSASVNGAGNLVPFSTESENSFSDRWNTDGNWSSRYLSEFRITGYSSYDAMLSLFGEDGTHVMVSGSMFDESAAVPACIISQELALLNSLNVGDTITISNPGNAAETYEMTIAGIYANYAANSEISGFSVFDPANNIYMNTAALETILDASVSANPDNAITAQTAFTYVLGSIENYESFKAAVEADGLPEHYILTSSDLSAYEKTLTPLDTLGSMTAWFFLIILSVGGVILVILNLRERKYEIGVLTAIGMKKNKVASQFMCELLIITFAAILVGVGIGASASVPVTNTLLEHQVEKIRESEETVSSNFGFSGGRFSEMLADRFGNNNGEEPR